MERKEFEAKLLKEFPNLFVDMYGDMRETCMAWGVDTGPGWYDIIYPLSQKLEQMILAIPEDKRLHYKASQVKEKLGGLRFYMRASTDEMEALIDEAEELSYQTCEKCGKPGQLCGDYQKNEWLYTSCKEHAKPQHKENFKETNE